jgi:hypothetical protein
MKIKNRPPGRSGDGFSITQYARPVKAMIRMTVIGKQQVDEFRKNAIGIPVSFPRFLAEE